MLILVLVLKDSLRTNFKSLSLKVLSLSLKVRFLSLWLSPWKVLENGKTLALYNKQLYPFERMCLFKTATSPILHYQLQQQLERGIWVKIYRIIILLPDKSFKVLERSFSQVRVLAGLVLVLVVWFLFLWVWSLLISMVFKLLFLINNKL